MRKLKKIFQSTIAKVTSLLLVILIGASVYFYYDKYERKYKEIKGYYFVYKGDKAYKEKNLQKAIYFYEKAIKNHPRHYKAMYNLANIYVAYEDYYSALENYEKALKVKPDYEIARIDYAIILSETHQTDEAIQEYEKVIKNEPKFYKIPFIIDNKKTYSYNKGIAYYNMGLAYRTKSLLAGLDEETSKKYLHQATESYEKALENIKTYNLNYNLALINQLLKKENKAGYYYCKAMENNPLEYEAHFNYAILLNDLKEYQASSEEFKKAGLLLDSIGDNHKTKYIYDILSDVNKKIATNADKDYYKKLKETEENDIKLTYKAGKVVFDDKDEEANKAMIENFKTCAKKELFAGDE